tara:strand:- start:1824 stop:2048 length:225 start_codon:yes stop_codon:yes gene_type:complete
MYKILQNVSGTANENGTEVKLYREGEMIDPVYDWQKDLMNVFVENGWAVETKAVEPTLETGTPVKKKRTYKKRT